MSTYSTPVTADRFCRDQGITLYDLGRRKGAELDPASTLEPAWANEHSADLWPAQ